jgi:hypothetical protein
MVETLNVPLTPAEVLFLAALLREQLRGDPPNQYPKLTRLLEKLNSLET